eukprot:8390449-Ditylum_brightwellii.AAC.1
MELMNITKKDSPAHSSNNEQEGAKMKTPLSSMKKHTKDTTSSSLDMTNVFQLHPCLVGPSSNDVTTTTAVEAATMTASPKKSNATNEMEPLLALNTNHNSFSPNYSWSYAPPNSP